MKNMKCPDRKCCWDYGDCENCDRGNHILKLHRKIDRLKKENEKLKAENTELKSRLETILHPDF